MAKRYAKGKTLDCICAEGFVKDHPEIKTLHNCAYVKARNKLIPKAQKLAVEQCGPEPPHERGKPKSVAYHDWCNKYDRIFHQEMDRLWKESAECASIT